MSSAATALKDPAQTGDEPEERADDPRQDIGRQIRSRRKEQGLTLQVVADAAGLTPGFISQVERGIAAPSLSSLAAIARVLDVDPSALFQQPPVPGPLTRTGARPQYSLAPGALRYERLTSSFEGNVLRSVIITEPPGHRSEPIRHDGEELFYILSGALTVEIDGEINVLQTGDSIHFASMRVHSSWNHTETETTLLHTCTMDVFGDADRAPTQIHDKTEPKPTKPTEPTGKLP